ncbi:Glutathione S-transferase S1 [Podila humilis]|nr:Glutathione S-transferase S1 [Podila humilis]
MVHTFFDPAQAATFNELAPRKDSTFEVTYFGMHGLGNTIRTILAVSGAKFKNVVPADWAAEKPKTPFGVMPLLKEIGANGKSIQVAENDAICRYLSRKFDLLGSNAFEETLINTFISSNQGLGMAIMKVFGAKDEESKAQIKATALESSILPWIKYHEQHLADNGSNGHYVGNKLSYADIQVAGLIYMVNGIWGADTISAKNGSSLLKVKANIESIPSFVAWTQTDDFKAFAAANKARAGF